jgi:hypothetical protein
MWEDIIKWILKKYDRMKAGFKRLRTGLLVASSKRDN